MPRSNWRFLLTALGLALLVGVIGGVIWVDAERLQRNHESRADQNAKAYRDTAGIHAERACSIVPAAERRDCVHDEYHEAREREREEYDLQAQLVNSVWTRAMGIAAIVAMAVGIVGVGLVYTTFRETKRTANEAKRQADAFIDAERGRLMVFSRGGNLSQNRAQIHVDISVTNHGGSPAILEEVAWAGFTDVQWPGHDFPDRESASRPQKLMVKSDATEGTGDVNVKADFPYVGGFVRYSTRFSPKNYSYFLFKLSSNPPNQGIVTFYNYDVEEQGGKGWPKDD